MKLLLLFGVFTVVSAAAIHDDVISVESDNKIEPSGTKLERMLTDQDTKLKTTLFCTPVFYGLLTLIFSPAYFALDFFQWREFWFWFTIAIGGFFAVDIVAVVVQHFVSRETYHSVGSMMIKLFSGPFAWFTVFLANCLPAGIAFSLIVALSLLLSNPEIFVRISSGEMHVSMSAEIAV